MLELPHFDRSRLVLLRRGLLPVLELLCCFAAVLGGVTAAPPPTVRATVRKMYMLSSDDDSSITSSAFGDVATDCLPAFRDGSVAALFVAAAMGNGADLLGMCRAAQFESGPFRSLSLELVDITLLRRFGFEVLLFGDSQLRISLGSCSDIVLTESDDLFSRSFWVFFFQGAVLVQVDMWFVASMTRSRQSPVVHRS